MKSISNLILAINLLFISVVLIFIPLKISGETFAQENSHKYINPTGNEFPIYGYYLISDSEDLKEDNFRIFRDAGFNIGCYPSLDTTDIHKFIDLSQKAGIKLMINCNGVKDASKISYFVKKFKNNPSIIAYSITDEPSTSEFDQLIPLCKAVTDYDSTAFPFINLYPYVKPKIMKASSYEQYLIDYIETINPCMLSFDAYPISKSNDNIIIWNQYFETLEIMSKISKKYDLPFWSFCLSSPHLKYPEPTKAHLLYEAFTGLAYGAQGICYYTYHIPKNHPVDFLNAPINNKGKKTKIWNLVKDVNKEIQNLSFIFLNAKVIDVWHTGSKQPIGTKPIDKLPHPIKSIKTQEKGILMSHLINNSKNYLICVNHDVENSQRIEISKSDFVKRISSKGKIITDKSSNFNLAPGGYIIFCW